MSILYHQYGQGIFLGFDAYYRGHTLDFAKKIFFKPKTFQEDHNSHVHRENEALFVPLGHTSHEEFLLHEFPAFYEMLGFLVEWKVSLWDDYDSQYQVYPH